MNYYPGLNSLRGLAVLCVIPSHIEQIKKHAGINFDHWFPMVV
jgi:peptidoglycan/LPS O-acetylase OafA/YrhL